MGLKSFIKDKIFKAKPEKSAPSAEDEEDSSASGWDSVAALAHNSELNPNDPSYQRRLREKGLNSKGEPIFADERTTRIGLADLARYRQDDDDNPNWQDQFIFVTDGDVTELQNSPAIEVGLPEDHPINEETAIRAISNDVFFDKVQAMLDGKIDTVSQMTCREYVNDSGQLEPDTVSLTNSSITSPAQLARTLEKLKQDGKLENLNETEAARIKTIEDATSVEAFRKYCNETELSETLDGKELSFDGNAILDFFDCSDEDLIAKLNSGEIPSGGSRAELAAFLDDNSSLFNSKYRLPENVRNHISYFIGITDHDFINQVTETNEPLLERTNISPELHAALVEGLPEDGSNLDKALYTYIKICKLLSYDERYFAGKDGEEFREMHRNIDYIQNITPENNRAVCYELTMILGKMLNENGINFEVTHFSPSGQKIENGAYGFDHANLRFRCDDIIVGADTVKEIYRSDLTAAKHNAPLSGLRIISGSSEARERFEKSYQEMYSLIQQQEQEAGNPEAEKRQRIDEALKEYTEANGGFEQISLEEKKFALLGIIEQSKFKGTDASARIYQLFEAMFSEEFDQEKANISVVRRDILDEESGNVTDIAVETILSFNEKGFGVAPDETRHYYVSNEAEIFENDSSEIQEVIDNNQITIVSNVNLKPIPNVNFTQTVSSRSV